MAISASDVKNLREQTGAGMMAVEDALKQTNGDFEAAVDFLRKKGLAAWPQKKQSRTAAEGVVVNALAEGVAVLLEVNCETDFVAKGDDFKGFAHSLAEYAASNKVETVEALREAKATDINELTLKCGEKVDVRRLVYLNTGNSFGFYNHGGKIGVLLEASVSNTSGATEELLKDVSMHVAASRPTFLKSDDIDEDFKAREAKIYTEQLQEQGKPEKMIPQIVEGKLRKLATEICLLEQSFVKNPDLKVSQHVAEVAKAEGAEINLVAFHTLHLGEGIEKER